MINYIYIYFKQVVSVNRELAERKFPVLIQYNHAQTIEVVGWIYQMFKSSV